MIMPVIRLWKIEYSNVKIMKLHIFTFVKFTRWSIFNAHMSGRILVSSMLLLKVFFLCGCRMALSGQKSFICIFRFDKFAIIIFFIFSIFLTWRGESTAPDVFLFYYWKLFTTFRSIIVATVDISNKKWNR